MELSEIGGGHVTCPTCKRWWSEATNEAFVVLMYDECQDCRRKALTPPAGEGGERAT